MSFEKVKAFVTSAASKIASAVKYVLAHPALEIAVVFGVGVIVGAILF